MNVFYEEDGGFKVAHVMADTGTSLQVETLSGKRSKIKSASVLLRFATPGLSEFMPLCEKLAADIDADFLWQVCGVEEFGFEALAQEYVGRPPTAPEAAAVILKLHGSPMYFYKKGKGHYRAAPKENLQAALASIERKKREAEQAASWIAQLQAQTLPEEMRPHLNMLLYKPDRNTLLVKAAEEAVALTGTPLPQLLAQAGAWPDRENAHYHYHLGKFLAEYFPHGHDSDTTVFDVRMPENLPQATVQAFSIDDAATTEIDDAFSVTPQDNGDYEIGIHIAAPALAFTNDSALDKQAAERLSTVYFPGHKITMLPAEAITHATLAEGRFCAAVSLYATFTTEGEIKSLRSAIERIFIARNLRIGELDTYFHSEAIAANRVDGPLGTELLLLDRFAKKLAARRGKNDNEQDRTDYNFDIAEGHITITPRKRGSPVDTVVSELMIFANTEWGRLLAENEVAAIYRAQANMKTRMTTEALPHQGLGVAQYAWCSSPLRRYVDLINQRQLVALLRGEAPAYARRSPELKELARRFDLTYEAYAEFQRNLERYWCLRYLVQENIHTFPATVIRDEIVRADALPLIVKLDRNPAQPSRTPVRVGVGALDYWGIGGTFSLITTSE